MKPVMPLTLFLGRSDLIRRARHLSVTAGIHAVTPGRGAAGPSRSRRPGLVVADLRRFERLLCAGGRRYSALRRRPLVVLTEAGVSTPTLLRISQAGAVCVPADCLDLLPLVIFRLMRAGPSTGGVGVRRPPVRPRRGGFTAVTLPRTGRPRREPGLRSRREPGRVVRRAL